MKKIILGAMASVAVLAAPASAFAAELVNNGGFETGNFSGWTQGGNTQATFVAPPNGNYLVPDAAPALQNYSAFLGPVGTSGTLSQALNTVAGDVYSVSFELANLGSPPNAFSVTVGGKTILDEDTVVSSSVLGGLYYVFTDYNKTFTATSSSTPLQFTFVQTPSYFVLDNVSVQGTPGTTVGSAVPEPATWALMLVGFGMVGAAMRQRKLVRRTNVAVA